MSLRTRLVTRTVACIVALGAIPGATIAQQGDGTDVSLVPPGAERDELLAAMSGHVLAAGEAVGTYRQTIAPLK